MDPSGGLGQGLGTLSYPGAAPSYYGLPPPPPLQQLVPYGVEIPNRIFVGGCPYNMTELELNTFFSTYGEVKDAKIITDRDGGRSKGYGFVTFTKEEDAAKLHEMESIYFEQKKLNISKAIRKHGGQYMKANQEYLNGQHTLWLHPNTGCIVSSQGGGGWKVVEQTGPYSSQPVKPCYSSMPAPGNAYTGPPHPIGPPHPLGPPHPNTNVWIGLGGQPANYYSPDVYNTGMASHAYYPITPTTSSGYTSLESSGSSSFSSSSPSYISTSHPAGQGDDLGVKGDKQHDPDMRVLEEETKRLCIDSAYTSEADLEGHQGSTATSSGNSSPKPTANKEEELEEEDSRNTPLQYTHNVKEFIPRSSTKAGAGSCSDLRVVIPQQRQSDVP